MQMYRIIFNNTNGESLFSENRENKSKEDRKGNTDIS